MKFRYLNTAIKNDLQAKMIFLGGPRQVGKTTLVKDIATEIADQVTYLNWDFASDRRLITEGYLPPKQQVIIFDEIHKYSEWKNYLKGIYDKFAQDYQIMVTGSARLNLYKKGGDSLLGRYHYHVLHPFSLAEMTHQINTFTVGKELNFLNYEANEELKQLYKFGGFPEPLLAGSETNWRRWKNERVDRLVREDIRDIQGIKKMSQLQQMRDFLPDKVGSLFSANSLAEDLHTSNHTIQKWLETFNNFYYSYVIYPYATTQIRSLRRLPKLYLWDWSEVTNAGAKWENLVGSHLLKFVHYLYLTQGHLVKLHFLRDRDQREVDFLVTLNNKPWFAVEVKTSFNGIDKNLRYFKKKLSIPYTYQVVRSPNIDQTKDDIRVISGDKFLLGLV